MMSNPSGSDSSFWRLGPNQANSISTPPPSYEDLKDYPPGTYRPTAAPSKPTIVNQPMPQHPPVRVHVNHGAQNQPAVYYPRGLEALATLDHLLIDQKETIFTTRNKYKIKNASGEELYHAVEDPDAFTQCCFKNSHEFEMNIFDNHENEVIHIFRPFNCCDADVVEVYAPPGTLVGTVEHESGLLGAAFLLKNIRGEVVFRIKRASWISDKFDVMSFDGRTIVGRISKEWSGFFRELFTDSDIFGITFPVDLDVRVKAVLLGACMLIDVMFYESR